MTKHGLEILVERVSTWPEAAQAEFVQSMANIENKHLGAYRLSEEERAAVRRGLEELKAGRFASEGEAAALFARYRG